MRLINKWSYACANSLINVLNENHQKRSIYYFSFQIIIGGIVKNIILITIALLLGIFIPTLLVILAFVSLRLLAGGYHMDTYGKCLFVSIGMFIIAALVARYTYIYWTTTYLVVLIVITFLSGLYILIRYAPKDTPHKPITDSFEIKKFKILSLIHLLVWVTLTSILLSFGFKMYVIALDLGIVLELFTITPTGHKFFDAIKYSFDKKYA